MCMILKSTEWPYQEDEVIFYKAFVIDRCVQSPCYPYTWKQGTNYSEANEKTIKEQTKNEVVQNGFHVFLNEDDAIQAINEIVINRTSKVIKVIGKKEDFIGIGGWSAHLTTEQAVFKNLEITQEEWNKLCV